MSTKGEILEHISPFGKSYKKHDNQINEKKNSDDLC